MVKRKRGPAKRANSEKESEYEDKKASQLNINSYEDVPDSEDEFISGRDKVLLEDEPAIKRRKERQHDEGMPHPRHAAVPKFFVFIPSTNRT